MTSECAIPEGYKRTQVGVVPEEWEIVELKEHAEQFIVPMRDKPKTFDGKVPWCRIEDFSGKYLYTSKSSRFVSDEVISSMNLRINPIGTVLCSCSAKLGICAIVGQPLITNQTFIGIVPKKTLDTEFLYYLMGSYAHRLQMLSTGTTIAYLPREKFEQFVIVYPPLPEQHKIASILSKVDEHISHTEAIIEKTEELKKGLMQQLLTKGIGHTKFKKTEIGEIPEEWDVRSLPHVFNVIDYRGRTPPFSDNGIPYIGADNIKNESIVFSNRRYVSDETYEEYMTRGIPNPGDILFTTEAPLGKVAQAPNYKFCLAQRLVAFQCKNDYDHTFFMYILKSDVVQKQFLDWSTGTTVKGISAKNMKFIKLSCPRDVTEQKRIGRILSQVDDQLSQNQTYLSHLQELKKGLMQDLLTGKVRVTV